MQSTTYHKAGSAADAAAALAGAEDGQLLAGGQTLIPTMKARLAAPSDLVDISGASDLKGISVSGNTVTIGAATTHAEVAGSAEIRAVCPSICDLAANIGDPAVRHRGTIGGSVANNDPAADYPAAMLALGATIKTDKREIAADDFFTGMFDTALDEGEIITGVSFPVPQAANYQKFLQPASRFALTGVFVAKYAGGVRVAVTGASQDGVFRWAEAEAALGADFSAGAVDGLDPPGGDMISDLHGSGEYRAHLAKVLTKRAVSAA